MSTVAPSTGTELIERPLTFTTMNNITIPEINTSYSKMGLFQCDVPPPGLIGSKKNDGNTHIMVYNIYNDIHKLIR